jgi:hypothetical protein
MTSYSSGGMKRQLVSPNLCAVLWETKELEIDMFTKKKMKYVS